MHQTQSGECHGQRSVWTADFSFNGALWGAGPNNIFVMWIFFLSLKHFLGNTNNKCHVWEHYRVRVNIYLRPKVAEWDIVLGYCNSNPESTALAKRDFGGGVEKCLYKVDPFLDDRTRHSAVICCCATFFPTCHKVGRYTHEKTTNGSEFAACDKWLGRKIYWDQPKNCFGFV